MAVDVRQQAEQQLHTPAQPHEVRDVYQTTCCVVGGGPAGMVLGATPGPHGIPTTLLEAHADFDRDFRGDTIHPAIMNILDEVGVASACSRRCRIRRFAASFRHWRARISNR